MPRDIRRMLRRALRTSPRIVARRAGYEVRLEAERYLAPRRARRFTRDALLRATAAPSLEVLWRRLGERAYPAYTRPVDGTVYEALCPGDRDRIMAAARAALERRVDLLGSGPLDLGARIDWHQDYKTGVRWPPAYVHTMDLGRLDEPCDVKFPWELSRLQWLLPAGQAYLLTGDERYACAVREVLDNWIAANPYAYSVNWGCAMEAALRILSWTWFFHVFHETQAWADRGFRERFLRALYLHADFVERHLERWDVVGNHCVADAAGLVFAGLFFGAGRAPRRWQHVGWEVLGAELERQVFADGVDFEASVPYHRLVLELVFLPALYRERTGRPVESAYRDRVVAMAGFTAAYTRPDGTVPLFGDADDGRALPLGGQPLGDHRYLVGLVGVQWNVAALLNAFAGSRSEVFWLLGPAAAALPARDVPAQAPASIGFPHGGFYVLRRGDDHLFVDCGPVGFGGRGGHGHNDCLSFEAMLDGVHLVSDSGAYVYTASCAERNRFRSTLSHNTPIVDGEEINRFMRPDDIWLLHDDARPTVRVWDTGGEVERLCGAHSGYRRLTKPVTVVRTFTLDYRRHALVVEDVFEGAGDHHLEIPLQLAPGVTVMSVEDGRVGLRAAGKDVVLLWAEPQCWRLDVGAGCVSPSYGVVTPATRLVWRRSGRLPLTFSLSVAPCHTCHSPLPELRGAAGETLTV